MKGTLKSHGGITVCGLAIVEENTANETGGTNKLKGISKLNNLVTEAGGHVWCAYQNWGSHDSSCSWPTLVAY